MCRAEARGACKIDMTAVRFLFSNRLHQIDDVCTCCLQTTCSQPLMTRALFRQANPFTVIPGSVSTGSLYAQQQTFLSLQIHIPITGGPIEVCRLLS